MPIKAATYLDANAGLPLKPGVARLLLDAIGSPFPSLANPSSIHAHGRRARRLASEAREKIAQALGQGIDPEQLVLTSSGSEANQLAVRGYLERQLQPGLLPPHWILSPVEHDSTLQLVRWLESRGGSVSYLPVDAEGCPEIDAITRLWRPETRLVSLVWVNNETGVIHDVARAASEVRRLGGALHVDGAQAWGKLSRTELDLSRLGANLVTFSGHKVGALAGTGVLWVASGTRIEPLLPGKQEKGRRAGTENLLGLVSLGAAAGLLGAQEIDAWIARVTPLRERLEREVLRRIPGARINGGGARRAPNTANLTFDGVEGDALVMALDLAGYSVSSGSACASGVLEPSHVLRAMGRSPQEAMAAVRVSLPDALEWESLEGFVLALEQAVGRVRRSTASASAH